MQQAKIKIPRQQRDLGTPEIIKKRAELTRGADPAFSEHPLGILHVRGFLCPGDGVMSSKMYHAGLAFGAIWGRVFTRPFAQGQLAPFIPGTAGSPEDEKILALANAKLREIRLAMKERQVYDALVNCVIYRRPVFHMNTLAKLRLSLCRLMAMDLSLDVEQ